MKKSTFSPSRISRLAAGPLVTTALLVQGCLQRPVTPQKPTTSNIFVERIENDSINEIDMLFVIDNSISMGDKQEIMKVAVPKMVERLVAPNCVDESGNVVGKSMLVDAAHPPTCAMGKLEFNPVTNIHLGIVSSSLGGHGSTQCQRQAMADEDGTTYYENDRGRLMGTVRPNIDTGVDGLGFLAWNGGDTAAQKALNDAFTEHVSAVGEHGCGFEATLEAWYRFLVDPTPPVDIVLDASGTHSGMSVDAGGMPLVDQAVLDQRKAFLRPQGLVAIVVLTDENDCSIMDGGDYYDNAQFGYLLATTSSAFTAATSVCAANPNDACCLSCLQRANVSDACKAVVNDSCGTDPAVNPPILSKDDDAANVRCFDNKRRFGVDLLYPTQRYVEALTRPVIADARTNGQEVPNPLMNQGGSVRPLGRVFFAGIVGVPWQDVATAESLDPANKDTLRYLDAVDLNTRNISYEGKDVNRWELMLGQPNLSASTPACQVKNKPESCGQPPVPPFDPFMIEQILPRETGRTHPLVPEAIVAATSNDPQANKINGHEYDNSVREGGTKGVVNDDLQYACIFPLAEPKDATKCVAGSSCDCTEEPSRNRPLCQSGGTTQAAQYWGKAYPGTRILEVLHEFGANSIVGSICPKVTHDPDTEADYGYNPAVQAIVDRLAEKLVGACLPRELSIDENGEVPCFVVEAKPPADVTDSNDHSLNCGAPGRREVEPQVKSVVLKQLALTGTCNSADHPNDANVQCDKVEMCEILPLKEEPGRGDCLYNQAPANSLLNAGYCYIDPAKQSPSGAYVAGGSQEEAKNANQAGTVPEDGTNLIVADCPATQRRLLRFVGADTPAANTSTLVACTGDAASQDGAIPSAPAASMPANSGN